MLTEDKVDVALAVIDLPWGTKLTAEMIKAVPMAKQYLPAGCYTSAAALEGRVLVAPLKQNEPIIESKLAPTSVTTGGVGAVVTPGKRAIAVAGDKVLGLAGFIQPGNRVDVLASLKISEKDKDHVTKVVLEDILVLASGTQIQNTADGKPAPVDVFTLEVTPEEGERLSLAATQGKLHFALRNIMDKEVVYTMGATIADTLDAYRPRVQLVKQPVVSSPGEAKEQPRRAFEVQTIKGSKVGKEVF
jgi:pilus assembly protein CpaB